MSASNTTAIQQVQSFRIVDSDPEASLHPRDIWRYWQKYVLWDPRTYYGLMECVGVVVIVLSAQEHRDGRFLDQQMFTGVIMLLAIAPLHWYSNYRASSHLLTRTRTHVIILLALAGILFVLQTISMFRGGYFQCNWADTCEIKFLMEASLWTSIGICIFTAYIIYAQARPQVNPLYTEIPGPEDETQAVWTDANVAEGILDDSLEPEGQVRL